MPTLRRDDGDWDRFLLSAAQTWVTGTPITWPAPEQHRPVVLPPYAFARERYWLPDDVRAVRATADPEEGRFWDVVGNRDIDGFADLLGVTTGDGELEPALTALSDWHGRRHEGRLADESAYQVRWVPVTVPPGAHPGLWVLVAGTGCPEEPLTALGEQIRNRGGEVVTVHIGNDRAALADRLTESLAGRRAGGVAAFLGWGEDTGPDALWELVVLTQGTADAGVEAPLWCVTTGAVSTGPGDAVRSPVSAGLWGLGRAAGLETGDRWGGLVDLPGASAAATLADVLTGTGPEREIAVRGTGSLARRLANAVVTDGEPVDLDGGTVLVTGGTGALGTRVVRWLVEQGAAKVVVASRGGTALDELGAWAAERGALVESAACDVSDRQAVERLVHGLTSLRGVVHAAGVVGDGVLGGLDRERFDAVCAPKITGAWHLHEATRDLDLAFFVMFSSVSGVWGSGGQGAYPGANGFLDGLASYRRGLGLAATSVAWGPWAGGGMAADEHAARHFDRHGLTPVRPEVALAALGRALTSGRVNTVVATIDWSLLAPVFDAAGLARLFADLPEACTALADRGREKTDGFAQRIEGLPAAERERVVAELVVAQVANVLGHRDPGALDRTRPFSDLGFDSLMVVELRNRLATATAMTFSATVAYEHPTPAAVVEHVLGRLGGGAHEPVVAVARAENLDDDPVVIVGMACRYPGGITSPDGLWEFVDGGGDGISAYPADRGWAPVPGGTGGFLDGAGDFDAAFFGISPREALAMDPQQRLALECSWEALERAGLDPVALRGSDTGVFLGLSHQDYGLRLHESGSDDTVEGYVMTGNSASVGSGRIAYALGLEGPAVSVDTACSSSLVALHWATRSLRSGECTLAVTGGVTVMATPGLFAEFERQGGLAGDGRCKAFSAAADGTGLAEGVGVLVLQRRSDALREGRRVLATVRGSAINSDGASNGLSAPNGRAQQRVIARALADAGLSTVDVDAVEAHGTGTRLGDPIEAHALLATYGQGRERPLLLGSLKSNIGHTQAAAGVAGVIKMVEAMRRGALPATRHVDAPSEHIDWDSGAVELLTEPRAWPETSRPRRAGVSSFGISGTNAHVILEQAEETVAGQEVSPAGPVPWLLSARSEAALRERAAELAEATGPVLDVGWSLVRSRAGLAHRAVVTGRDHAELAAGLRRLAEGDAGPGVVRGEAVSGGADAVAVLFSGQGAQRAGMGSRLYARFPVFASALDDVCGRFELPRPLREVMFAEIEHENPLDQTEFTQPALFAFEVALYRLLESWGLRPQALAGHSIGELTAAYLAGVWSLDDACKLVAARGRLMQALPGNDTVSRSGSVAGGGGRRAGAMVSLQASEAEVLPLLTEGVSIAAINAPDAVVVSGDVDAVDGITVTVGSWGRKVKPLRVSHAFHSPHMDGMLDEFASVAAELDYHAPRLPLVSGTTGEMATAGQLADPAYWVAHVRQAVRFADEVAVLLQRGVTRFVEVGPDAVLAPAVHASLDTARATVTAMQRRHTEQADTLLDGIGKLYVAGVDLDWTAVLADFFPGHEPRPVDLPTYPFQHERFWITTTGVGAAEENGSVFGVDWMPVEAGGAPVPDVTVLRPSTDPGAVLGALQRFLADPAHDDSTLVVFTDGAVAATDVDRVPALDQAPISGLVRSAQTEYPGRIVLVDGDPDRVDAGAAAALGEPQLAWRAGGWLAPRLTPIAEPAQRAGSPWEQGGTVLVTGGTGALGKEIARHLARAHGVRRLVLTSRRGLAADGAGDLVRELAGLGCTAQVVAADAGDRGELARLLAGIPAGHPLTGVVHAAGVLDDGVLASLTPARIARVLHAKADAARHLDDLTRALPVSNFVLLSGFIGLLGGAGQAAYAAANAQLDAVAAHRRALGLPGVSLAWGLWNAEGSMAAGLDGQALRRLARYGIVPMSSETSLALFDRCFNAEAPLLVPAGLNLGASELDPPALYRALPLPRRAETPVAAEEEGPRLRAKLASIQPAGHRRFLLGFVRAEAAAVLGHASVDRIDARTGFLEQGFDSLTGVELRNRLIAASGETLPSTLIFDYPSPEAMADYLARELAEPVAAGGFGELEDHLEEIMADPGLRQETAGRLRRMLARIEGNAMGTDIVVGFDERLGEADDEDLFDFIDNELGV
ncbi:SDR family NAD(P)-dependent oxidoreductase [Amycolatopsis minnesotensis]|uniref:SDR family NAD(P)-dependent oxidoreductase n=1 Tax=Amycolatopsis minnesotensis TaxID=337894 RepID=UPI0031DC1BFD